MGADVPKAFIQVGGRTLLEHAVATAISSGEPGQIVVAVPEGWESKARGLLDRKGSARLDCGIDVVAGGVTRSDSVAVAESVLADEVEFVLVHDAARAFAPAAMFRDVAEALRSGARSVVPGLPVADTIKVVDQPANGSPTDPEHVAETLDRRRLRAVQTPQGFRREDLAAALGDMAARKTATDDAQLVENLGVRTQVVRGHPAALKLTHGFDVLIAGAVLQYRRDHDQADAPS